tara:strand:+ start:753 stop:2153 length:1401 start_codon:yes stop_codon:yes gene_type:complete
MIDSNIALGVQPVKIDNPLNALAQAMQIRSNQQSNDLGQMKIDDYQRGVQSQNSLRDYFKTGNQNSPGFADGIGAIDPAYMQQYKKAQLDSQQKQGEINKQNSDLVDSRLKQSKQFLSTVTTPEEYLAWNKGNHDDDVLGPILNKRGITEETTKDSVNNALKTPGGFQQLLQQSALGLDKFTEMNKPTVTTQNLGGTSRMVSTPGMGGSPTVLSTSNITQTPDSKANTGLGYARLNFDKSKEENSQDSVMDPLAVRMAAQQYLAGDTSALQNFGRGSQGANNLNAVRLEITKQANDSGLNGADIAAKVAEFSGIKAGQRTVGTRNASIEIAANEASQLIPLALDASNKVSRSGLLPFGKAQIMFDSNTNDPNLRQFAMANNALANAYGQVMSRGGTATVSDKDHAKELLSTAFDQPSYAAAVQQLQAEIKAAQSAPEMTRKNISKSVSGKSLPDSSIPNGWTVKEN